MLAIAWHDPNDGLLLIKKAIPTMKGTIDGKENIYTWSCHYTLTQKKV